MSAPVDLSHVLLPYQGRWVASGLTPGWTLRVAEKSRRIGITWAEALRHVLTAMRTPEEGGCDCFYMSTAEVLSREYVETCAMWAEALERARPGHVLSSGKAIGVDRIRFRSGHKIDGLTSRPAQLRGRGGDVVIDEAAHHPSLPEMLKAAFAVGMWEVSGLTVISTHNGAENPFALLVEQLRAGKRRGFLFSVDLEGAAAEGLYRRICAVTRAHWTESQETAWLEDRLSEDGADEEYRCIPARSGIVYFRRDLLAAASSSEWRVVLWRPGDDHVRMSGGDRESAVRRWIDVELEPAIAGLHHRHTHYIGVDFARSCAGDLSVFAVLVERPDLRRAVALVVELRGVPFEEQWEILRHLIDGLGVRFGGVGLDGQGNGSWLAEQAVSYVGEAQAVVSSGDRKWRQTHYPRVRSALEERRLSLPADADLLGDFGLVRLEGGVPTVPKNKRTKSIRDGGQRHADGCVAVVQAFAVTTEAMTTSIDLDDEGDEEASVYPRGGRGF